jgi:hypothetical protein
MQPTGGFCSTFTALSSISLIIRIEEFLPWLRKGFMWYVIFDAKTSQVTNHRAQLVITYTDNFRGIITISL